MSIQCVGYEVKKGSFTNDTTGEIIDYDNTIIYYTNDGVENVCGCYCGQNKVKNSELKKVLGGFSISDIVGHEIKPSYAPYGNRVVLTSIDVVWRKLKFYLL